MNYLLQRWLTSPTRRCRPAFSLGTGRKRSCSNAGATPVMGPLQQQTWQDFSRNWDVDVQQVFNFLREALSAPIAGEAS